MLAYTDFPFIFLGDEFDDEAPIRKIELIAYDGNKMVTVRLEGGENALIRKDYCYREPKRYEKAARFPESVLKQLPRPD
jgi:hypothetical protein